MDRTLRDRRPLEVHGRALTAFDGVRRALATGGLRAICVVAVGLTAPACGLRGQEPPSPRQLVATIQQAGSIMPVVSHLSLDTCPGGRTESVFDVISEAELPPSAMAELAAFWRPLLDRCGSTALQRWYDRALGTMLDANDPGARAHFLEFLPTDLSAESRAALWRAAERESVGSLPRGQMASRAVRSDDTAQRIALTVEAFRGRDMSADWIYEESGVVLREDAEGYLTVLAHRSVDFEDARLSVVLGVINAHVRAGAIDEESPALGTLRSAIAGRTGISAELRALRRGFFLSDEPGVVDAAEPHRECNA